jgi:hypothetical protein
VSSSSSTTMTPVVHENDQFETKEEALTALREIGTWVEKASLPTINPKKHHEPLPSLQSEQMVEEMVDLTSSVSDQRPSSLDTVERAIHVVDLEAPVVAQTPTAGSTIVEENTRVQLKSRTLSHMTDRPRLYSARAMTKNERRLHASLRAKFDGRGIPSRATGSKSGERLEYVCLGSGARK